LFFLNSKIEIGGSTQKPAKKMHFNIFYSLQVCPRGDH
jgi:hypothetical protein